MAVVDTNDPEAVRAAAREILARDEFRQPEHHWWDTLYFYLTHPDLLAALAIDWLAEQYFEGTTRQLLFAWMLTALIVVLAIVFVFRLLRSTSADRAFRVEGGLAISSQSSAELFAEADAHEKEGNWSEAVRVRYAATIARFGEEGLVNRRPGKTSGEYAHEVAKNVPGEAEAFFEATRLFELVWYGDHEASERDAHELKRLTGRRRGRAVA